MAKVIKLAAPVRALGGHKKHAKQPLDELRAMARRLRELRAQQGLTQQELAEASDTARSTIAGIEAAHDTGGIHTILKIANYFKVPLDYLLDRSVPAGGPLITEFVYRESEIAILTFWRRLDEPQRWRVLRYLSEMPPTGGPDIA